MPTTSSNPEAEHKRFWEKKLTRPIDDPFWNKHRPGDRWNCKCSLEATDEPPTDIPDDADDEKPQRGLRGNPAKTGQIFDKSHPYFPKKCASCGFNKKKGTITSRLRGWFNRDKDCYYCPYIKGCVDRAEAKKSIDDAANAKKREVRKNNSMPPYGDTELKNLYTGVLHRTGKVRGRFLKHAHHDYDVDAAAFVWNNPNKLQKPKFEKLGAVKDLSDEDDIKNIKNKEKRGVNGFVIYELKHKKRTYIVKCETTKYGFEQFYAIQEKP